MLVVLVSFCVCFVMEETGLLVGEHSRGSRKRQKSINTKRRRETQQRYASCLKYAGR